MVIGKKQTGQSSRNSASVMQENSRRIKLPGEIVDSVKSTEPVSGYTHNYYQYPARFSPEFPRSIIKRFSTPGDVIIDPFSGSGTALVEAIACGRNAIGSDINPIASFLASVKTDPLCLEKLERLQGWIEEALPKLDTNRSREKHKEWSKEGYQKDLPPRITKVIEFALDEVQSIDDSRLQKYARCAILRAGQKTLDCTEKTPTPDTFKLNIRDAAETLVNGAKVLNNRLSELPQEPSAVCLNKDAAKIQPSQWDDEIEDKPSLVVTSPPYPGVHVLYHRWQIRGRRETPAPYWIIGTPDGHGGSHYTMGSRTEKGINDYFESLKSVYKNLHNILCHESLVFQLVGFSEPENQLPRFLKAMTDAGFEEVEIHEDTPEEGPDKERVTRRVPNRKWYASLQGKTPSTKEFLFIHQR